LRGCGLFTTIGALALFSLSWLDVSGALAQELGPGPIQLPRKPGPIQLPRNEPGSPFRPSPKGSTVGQALGCHYAECLPSDRSCIQFHGRGGYRVCPPVVRR
jgi:hypothetical protein